MKGFCLFLLFIVYAVVCGFTRYYVLVSLYNFKICHWLFLQYIWCISGGMSNAVKILGFIISRVCLSLWIVLQLLEYWNPMVPHVSWLKDVIRRSTCAVSLYVSVNIIWWIQLQSFYYPTPHILTNRKSWWLCMQTFRMLHNIKSQYKAFLWSISGTVGHFQSYRHNLFFM